MQSALLASRAALLATALPVEAEGIILGSGDAFPGLLPDLAAAADLALSRYRFETLQYAPLQGLPELRAWVADYLRKDGARVTADEVAVVNGAKHGIELVCRLMLEEGDSIVVTAPTYFTAIPIFRSFGAKFIEINQDANGLDVSELEGVVHGLLKSGDRLPKFIYNVPDFHNPTGITMPRARREAMIDLAVRHGILIVEDSPYRTVRFEGQPEPMLKALDSEQTILVGTFAKLIAPGLRIGWISASTDILGRILRLKSDGGSCALTQRIVIEFCKAGKLPKHIARVRDTYRAHRDRMIRAVEREMPPATFVVPQGGYYLWVRLPDWADGDELARRAARTGVSIVAGSEFFARSGASKPRGYVRLAYSHSTLEQIDEGLRRVAAGLNSMANELAVGRSVGGS